MEKVSFPFSSPMKEMCKFLGETFPCSSIKQGEKLTPAVMNSLFFSFALVTDLKRKNYWINPGICQSKYFLL